MFAINAKSKLVNLVAAVALTATAVASGPASAYERWIRVENVGSSGITGIYITHIDEHEDWGRNLIDGDFIEAGATMEVEPRRTQGYCRFDILVEYEDGDEVTVWDVDLCTETDLTVNENRYWI